MIRILILKQYFDSTKEFNYLALVNSTVLITGSTHCKRVHGTLKLTQYVIQFYGSEGCSFNALDETRMTAIETKSILNYNS